ncbi:stalk domain-containing protein [Domibacillus indicus]|uniref:stalk domain-containing protein n=1 Tax=Domibacillus indicus TaxID=1437523 RepID=UPI000618294A|nr:stalk domain-containing protein [Domibacillus indicus]
MKKVLLFSVVLLVLSGSLITVQWIGYEKLSSASEKVTADQTLEIDVQDDGFSVKQTLHSLPERTTLTMKLPADVQKLSCSRGDKCVTASQSGTITAAGGDFYIQYRIPASLSSQSFLLNNWQASFEGVDIVETNLQITDHTKKGGQWISSLAQTASKSLSMIDFYSFEGKIENPPLFWQKSPMPQSRAGSITVFAENPVDIPADSVSVLFSEKESAAQVIVITQGVRAQQLNGLTFIQKESDLGSIRTKMINDYLAQYFVFPEEEQWMISLLAAALYNEQPEEEKAAGMNKEIISMLTEEEQKKWKAELWQLKGQKLSSQKLDEALSSVKGEQTDYFEKNKSIHSPAAALTFFDGRPVMVEEVEASFHIKKKDSMLYIPLKEAAKALGFSVKEEYAQELLMRKDFETYQFYLSRNQVLLNKRPYTLYETALQKIDGAIYIDKIWFQKIFLVEVQETKEAVHLKSYGL